MSSTTKTVLVVGGAAVGVFVLLKLLSPSPIASAYGKQPPNTGVLSVNGITGLAKAFGGLFGSSSSSNSPAYGFGVQNTDTATQQTYAISHDVVDQQGNQLIDLNTGNALTYGAD